MPSGPNAPDATPPLPPCQSHFDWARFFAMRNAWRLECVDRSARIRRLSRTPEPATLRSANPRRGRRCDREGPSRNRDPAGSRRRRGARTASLRNRCRAGSHRAAGTAPRSFRACCWPRGRHWRRTHCVSAQRADWRGSARRRCRPHPTSEARAHADVRHDPTGRAPTEPDGNDRALLEPLGNLVRERPRERPGRDERVDRRERHATQRNRRTVRTVPASPGKVCLTRWERRSDSKG